MRRYASRAHDEAMAAGVARVDQRRRPDAILRPLEEARAASGRGANGPARIALERASTAARELGYL